MDKANRNFDKANATKDKHGNITAKNQNGLTATGRKRKSPDKNCKLVPASSL